MTDLQEPKSKKPAGEFVISFYVTCIIFVLLEFLSVIDTAFKQQRLPAWQPILTARNVMPIFFAVAAAFIPIGLGLLYLTNQVNHLCTYIFQLLIYYIVFIHVI